MKIVILKNVMLAKNLSVYTDKKGDTLYTPSENIIECDNKYLDRFSKYPLHIKIIEEEVIEKTEKPKKPKTVKKAKKV